MTPQEQRTAFAADYRDEEQDITVLTANPCNAVFSISGAPLYRAESHILAYWSGQQLHSEPLVGGFGHIHSLAAPADFSGKKLKRLRLAELAVGAGDAFTAWLDAGDTFNGEPVSLGVTPAGELDDPYIGT